MTTEVCDSVSRLSGITREQSVHQASVNSLMFGFIKTLTYKFGAATYPNGGQHGPLFGRHLYIFHVKSGEVSIEADGITRKFCEGQAGLVYSDHALNFNCPEKILSDVLWCSTGEINLPPGVIERIRNLPPSLGHCDDLITLLGMGVDTGERENRYKTNMLGAAVLAAYIYNAEAGKKNGVYPFCVLKVKEFIERHFTEDHNLDSIAQVFSINPRYLLKLYKQYFDVTPSQYLWNLRLEKGLKLLFTSDLPISRIALLSGFKNSNHFSHYIKKNFDVPPTKLRDRFHHSYRPETPA